MSKKFGVVATTIIDQFWYLQGFKFVAEWKLNSKSRWWETKVLRWLS